MIKILICLIVLAGNLVVAQINSLNRNEKLQQLKNRDDVKVTEVGDSILKLEYPNGKVLYKNIGNYQYPKSSNQHPVYSPTYDSTVIDLTTIDSTLYYHKYSFWQEVPVAPAQMPMPIKAEDINQNYLPELYGFEKHYQTNWDSLPLKIFELDPADSIFKVVYTYTDTITRAECVYDINGDGQLQLFTSSNNWLAPRLKTIYKKTSPKSFAIMKDFHFTVGNQMRDPTLGDYNNNELTDLVHYSLDRYTAIAEYDPIHNMFDSLYAFPEPDIDCGGFSVEDIDGDGYSDIVLGTIHGFVRVLEYQPGTGYQNIWNDTLDTYNAYVHFTTSDIDGNGLPEFWVGGDAFYGGVPKTLYTCYESNWNNNYKVVAKIWIEGVFSFDAYNAFTVDVDKDGVEELGICVDQHFLILKFTGSPNQHSYELYYIKKNEMVGNYNVYYGASMYDLTGDSNEEILISRQQENNGQLRLFTSIYRPSAIVPVELTSFTVLLRGNNVLLNWSTASELNNKGFEIERSSVNGQWSLVGFVEGHGTTSEQQNYSYKDSSLTSGKYSYRLKQIDYDGSFKYSNEIEVDFSIPLRYSLEQNYPNPFNPITKIQYAVGNRQFVNLKVYDILGNEVAALVNEEKQPGVYEVEFNAKDLSSGIYFYQLSAGDFNDAKKLILLK
jgi:hypothetical protein